MIDITHWEFGDTFKDTLSNDAENLISKSCEMISYVEEKTSVFFICSPI